MLISSTDELFQYNGTCAVHVLLLIFKSVYIKCHQLLLSKI